MKPRPTDTFFQIIRYAHARKKWYVYGMNKAKWVMQDARLAWRHLKDRDLARNNTQQ